jgi:16S rRNA G966 N2-methylase RsmD
MMEDIHCEYRRKGEGQKTQGPEGPDIRPITDRIKEALFNTLGHVF